MKRPFHALLHGVTADRFAEGRKSNEKRLLQKPFVDTKCLLYSFKSLSSKVFPSGYSENVCVCVRMPSENFEPTMWFLQTSPDEHPPKSLPCGWRALITLRTPTTFQLVWCRLCDDVLLRSFCLFEGTLCASRVSDWA